MAITEAFRSVSSRLCLRPLHEMKLENCPRDEGLYCVIHRMPGARNIAKQTKYFPGLGRAEFLRWSFNKDKSDEE